MRSLSWLALFAALTLIGGCGDGTNLADVSGRVTVDGKPMPNVYVMFQPVGTKDKPEPGRGSMAVTDGEGRFRLRYDGGPYGAVVGPHIVRISTVQEADDRELFEKYKETGTPDGEDAPLDAKGLRPELIPPEWNSDSKKQFVVPEGGTTEANFDIVLPKKTKKGR